MKRRNKKTVFLLCFACVVALLAIVRLIFPQVAGKRYSDQPAAFKKKAQPVRLAYVAKPKAFSAFFNDDGTLARHRVYGVLSFRDNFPDSNSVQLLSAKQFGVHPVMNRHDAQKRISELVYIGASPFYDMDKLKSSLPYLVPRAALLLQDIGRSFMDSLYIKGLPPSRILVTSVLRSKEDVAKLRSHNHNATVNSCHLYGTTFDISYNRFTLMGRKPTNDTLKLVLCEVLDRMRKEGRCYVKYERHQGCLHVTVR